MCNGGAERILGSDPEGAGADAKSDREEAAMISPSHVSAYNLRREELLAESARERLIAQAYQPVSQSGETRGHAPAFFMLTAIAAIAGWIASLG